MALRVQVRSFEAVCRAVEAGLGIGVLLLGLAALAKYSAVFLAAGLGVFAALLAWRFKDAPGLPDQRWFALVAFSASAFTGTACMRTGQKGWCGSISEA